MYLSDYIALDNPDIDCLRDFDLDDDTLNYVVPLGFALGAKMLGCKTTTAWVNNANRKCLAYVNTVQGRITNVKLRAIDVKGFTQWRLPDELLPIPPYNIDCLWPERVADMQDITLIITEGEKDVCSLVTAGYNYVISAPNGASAKPEGYLDPFREWFHPVGKVIICHDEDEAGYKMMHNVRDYFHGKLGKAVGVTHLPYGFKDISEILAAKGEEGVQAIINAVSFPASIHLRYASQLSTEVCDVLKGIYDHGYGTGFGPLTDKHLWLTDEGGLIVVTGKPNSGKTDWCRCLMSHLAFHNDKGVCFCSFEEPNKAKHLASIVRVVIGSTDFSGFTPDQFGFILEYLDRRLVNIDLGEKRPTPNRIIRLCEEAMRQRQIKFLYVDPYLFIEPDLNIESETLQIKQVLTRFQSWGRRRHVWVVVVAHPRKLVKDAAGKFEEIDEYTISGSAHWANLADYLLSVKRVFVIANPAGEANGSANPSYTLVNVMKVRDQSLCHTGHLYYIRQPCGRYDERPSEDCCKRELTRAPIAPNDIRLTDDSIWIPMVF